MDKQQQKIHIIANEEIVILFGLLGIGGTILDDESEFIKTFDDLCQNPAISIIIISINLSEENMEYILTYKLNRKFPFIFYLPDLFGEDINEEFFLKDIGKTIKKVTS